MTTKPPTLDSRPDLDPSACTKSKDYLGPEEEEVLARIRALKAEVAPIKRELAELDGDSPRRAELQAILEQSRARFRALQVELTAANVLKLRRLGHIP